MKKSKRAINQKKRQFRLNSRKQRGSSGPYRTKHFSVYYNYVISNFQNEGGRNGELLVRKLNTFELAVCEELIRDTRDVIIQDHAPQFVDLEVSNVVQLQNAYKGKHFRLSLTIKNKNFKEALALINEFMQELLDGNYLEFYISESDDKNRYITKIENNNDIEFESF